MIGAVSFMRKFKISAADREILLSAISNFDIGLRVYGFHKYTSTVRYVEAYQNKKMGIVVKIPGFILESRTPLCVRAPTITLESDWVVQPLVERRDLAKAVKTIERKLKPFRKRGIHPDVHVQNVGFFQNRAVLFDW